MPCRLRSSVVIRETAASPRPIDAAVIVMSLSFDRFSSRWSSCNGM